MLDWVRSTTYWYYNVTLTSLSEFYQTNNTCAFMPLQITRVLKELLDHGGLKYDCVQGVVTEKNQKLLISISQKHN